MGRSQPANIWKSIHFQTTDFYFWKHCQRRDCRRWTMHSRIDSVLLLIDVFSADFGGFVDRSFLLSSPCSLQADTFLFPFCFAVPPPPLSSYRTTHKNNNVFFQRSISFCVVKCLAQRNRWSRNNEIRNESWSFQSQWIAIYLSIS